jgi:hypothetical protein
MASTSNPNVPFPKPPTPDPPVSPVVQYVTDLNDIVPPPADPPPPYPAGSRTGRRARGNTTRSSRRAAQISDDSQVGTLSLDSGGESETSPLLGARRRPRTTSHSSTVHSVHSLAHTVLSLFAEPETHSLIAPVAVVPSTADLPFFERAKRYFRPMTRKVYYAALFHLLLLNFPYELAAWIFLFAGTLVSSFRCSWALRCSGKG